MNVNFKPNDLALLEVTTSTRLRVVEIISYPIPPEMTPTKERRDGKPSIMARMVPGDPTTLREIDLDKLQPMKFGKRRYVYIAEVTVNIGSFPEDMLRYDGASLYDPDQPEEVEDDFGRSTFRPVEPILVYRVSERRNWQWTVARWVSFGCRIVPIKCFDLTKQL